VVQLAQRCDQTLLRLLEGQYLDMSFETGWTATEALYERMIDGKSASLVRYCFEAGALLAGASSADVETLGRCGRALGLGFQVRDDILGIWGAPDVTGKPLAGDIYTRKKSLPLLIAMERATEAERTVVRAAYAQPQVDDAAVARVLAILDRTLARSITQRRVEGYHAEALAALESVGRQNDAAGIIRGLIESMVARAF
jgi:geranylgeranyl diphosphate synthase type I